MAGGGVNNETREGGEEKIGKTVKDKPRQWEWEQFFWAANESLQLWLPGGLEGLSTACSSVSSTVFLKQCQF